jgi:DNA-3-methyladenine glycosylase
VRKIGQKTIIGKIVETEAYLGPYDLASHTSKGKTKRNGVMFGPIGHAYVYLIYGMHHCLNVVTGKKGDGAAVLIRAVEPIENGKGKTSGPGLLCRAFHITLRQNGRDLFGSDFFIGRSTSAQDKITIVTRPRVGVDYAKRWAKRKLRFYIKGNPFVSKK